MATSWPTPPSASICLSFCSDSLKGPSTSIAQRLRCDVRLRSAFERETSRLFSFRLHSIFIQFAIARPELIDCIERISNCGGWKRSSAVVCKLLKKLRVWLRGVDLISKPALIPRKLLTFQHAKMPKTATRANLSFSFHSVCLKRILISKMHSKQLEA